MDRLCSTIFLLLTRSLISNALQEEQLNVHVEPKYIKFCEGDSVTINCTFHPGGKYKVKWYYSQTNLGCNSAATDKINAMGNIIVKHKDTGSTFNISPIMTNDSGWYFCKVIKDIPFLEEKCSNGVQVEVQGIDASSTTEYTNPTDNQTQNPTTDLPTTCTTSAPTTIAPPPFFRLDQWWIWLAVAIGCVVLVVSIVVCILTRKTTELIYENTKPVESGCWKNRNRNQNQMDISKAPASKKTETIKPLRKYDTLSSHRIHKL